MTADEVGDFEEFHGLGDEAVHADFQAAVAVAGHGVGGEGNDAGLPVGWQRAADADGRFNTVEFRHLEVHEDELIGALGDGLDGFEPVGDGVGFVAETFEEAQGDLLIDGVVLGEEHGEGEFFREVERVGFLPCGGGRAGGGKKGVERSGEGEGAQGFAGGGEWRLNRPFGKRELGGGEEPEDGNLAADEERMRERAVGGGA